MKDLKADGERLVEGAACADGVDRRVFLKAAVGTGFALATLPVSADTVIKTSDAGLTAGEVILTVKGQAVPVYRAQPAGKTDLPVMLVISEIFGVHEYIADVARRFARLGYLAIAPDLFERQGDPLSVSSMDELRQNIIAKTPDEQVMADLDACVAWAAQNGGNPDKVGINGFCWGGRVVWLYSAHNPKLKAGVAWYGRLEGDVTPMTPRHPIDIAPNLKVPVLGLYGGKDSGIPLESVERMKAALARGSSNSAFHVYPNAGHAFHADYRPSYVEADARDGFARALAWFKSHGVA